MSKETTHIRIPVDLKTRIENLAEFEQRNQLTVLTRLLTQAIAIEEQKNGRAIAS
jgi:predicted transcriptional regulator